MGFSSRTGSASDIRNYVPYCAIFVPRVFVPLDQRSRSERPWKVPIWSPKISGWIQCACLAFKTLTKELFGVLLLSIFIVFQAKQIRPSNRTFDSSSFRQACAVRNKDSRYEDVNCASWSRETKTLGTRLRTDRQSHGNPNFSDFGTRLRKLPITQLACVYFKLGFVNPAFIWSRRLIGARFINGLQFSANFSDSFIVTDLRHQGAVCQGGTIFFFVLSWKSVPGYPKVIISHRCTITNWIVYVAIEICDKQNILTC